MKRHLRRLRHGATIDYKTGYAGMIEAFRARARERRLVIGGESVAAISGLPVAYIAKLLQPRPTKRIGAISLGPLLGVLGLKLVVMEDLDAVARFGSKLEQRRGEFMHSSSVHFAVSRRQLRAIQRKGGRNSRFYMSKRQASAIARKAAKARWAKRKQNGHSATTP